MMGYKSLIYDDYYNRSSSSITKRKLEETEDSTKNDKDKNEDNDKDNEAFILQVIYMQE